MARNKKTSFASAPRRSLPARGAKITAIANLCALNAAESAPQLEEAAEDCAEIIDKSPQSKEPAPIQGPLDLAQVFRSFSTNVELQDGLCIVRSLENGKYEIVSLDSVTVNDLTTDDIKKRFANNTERLNMFNIDARDWKEASFKCHQAVMGAAGQIFHFLKLPIEIRYYIYELCLVVNNRLKFVPYPNDKNSSTNPALLRTCQAIYDEAIKFWCKNTFYVDFLTVRRDLVLEYTENIQNLEINFDGSYRTDIQIADVVARCENLRVLKIQYGIRVLTFGTRSKRQHLHQTDKRVAKFSQLSGHDVLCSLRGLEYVEVSATESFRDAAHTRMKLADLKDYQEFLMELVTLRKATEEEIVAKAEEEREKAEAEEAAAMAKKRRNIAWRRRQSKFVGIDGEYDGSWD